MESQRVGRNSATEMNWLVGLCATWISTLLAAPPQWPRHSRRPPKRNRVRVQDLLAILEITQSRLRPSRWALASSSSPTRFLMHLGGTWVSGPNPPPSPAQRSHRPTHWRSFKISCQEPEELWSSRFKGLHPRTGPYEQTQKAPGI